MKITKVLAMLSIVALLGTTGVVAFAADNTMNNIPKERPLMTNEQKAEMKTKMEERLSQALADGKITQEQYDSMLNGSLEGRMHKFGGKGFKGERPNLTDEQKAEMKVKMEERLSQALADGKITQEQYDSMLSGSLEGRMHKFGGKGFKGEQSNLND